MKSLQDIASCFQGVIPSYLATVDSDGVTNITSLSVVHLLGNERVGLSCQFMNKSLKNLEQTRKAQVMLMCPNTLNEFQLDLHYLGPLCSGPVFQRMDTKISGVASQSGMEGVFALKSVLECEVTAWRSLSSAGQPDAVRSQASTLELLDAVAEAIQSASDLETLLEVTFGAVEEHLGFHHGFFLMAEADGSRFYTLASHGFDDAQIGSEVALGEGIYGTSAERMLPVRIGSLSRERLMSRAVAREIAKDDARQLPLPGLANAESSLAVPLSLDGRCLGVLCFQSSSAAAFTEEHERMMSIVARHLAAMIGVLGVAQHPEVEVLGQRGPIGSRALAVRVRFFESDGSIFLDNNYVIKGTAGRILWSLVNSYVAESREEFSNKEIRLDQNIGLPAIKDNLEARLIALRKRLAERASGIQIEKTGRGRFRLRVDRELILESRQ